MARVTLQEAITKEVVSEVTVKEALICTQCDSCGTNYKMEQGNNSSLPGYMIFTFADRSNPNKLYTVAADVCSFDCASKLFNNGWKALPDFAAVLAADATLLRANLTINLNVLQESDIVAAWSQQPQTPPANPLLIP